MRLCVVTPVESVVTAEDVHSVIAEDESGSFGILPGHADLITVLTACVVTWRDTNDQRQYVAVRNGILSVSTGNQVYIATREAVRGANIDELRQNVLTRFRRVAASPIERVRIDALHTAAMRQIMAFLNPNLRISAMLGDGGASGEQMQ